MMLVELKKSTMECMERTLAVLKMCVGWKGIQRGIQQKLHSINNDLLLLKDNLSLIMSTIHYLQTKSSKKQFQLEQLLKKYQILQEQANTKINLLKNKCERQAKELLFLKYTNINLRKELSISQPVSATKLIKNIEVQLKKGTTNICEQIDDFLKRKGQDDKQQWQNMQEIFLEDSKDKQRYHKKGEYMQQGQVNRLSTVRKKTKSTYTREQVRKNKEYNFSKKKSEELAKLVEEQGRLSQLREKYLSTDLI